MLTWLWDWLSAPPPPPGAPDLTPDERERVLDELDKLRLEGQEMFKDSITRLDDFNRGFHHGLAAGFVEAGERVFRALRPDAPTRLYPPAAVARDRLMQIHALHRAAARQ